MFQDEEMVCIMSGRRQKADPNVESNWDAIQLDDKFYYVSAQWREKSYKKRGIPATQEMMFKKALELFAKDTGRDFDFMPDK